MTQELQNGEHTEDWPEADLALSADDSDAPVTIGETAGGDAAADDAATDVAAPGDNDSADDDGSDDAEVDAQAARDNMEHEETAADIRDAGNVDIKNGGARDIDATSVSITQGGARDIEATTVTINQGGAARIRADELSISQGGVALARTEHLTIQDGGNAFLVVADKAALDPETSVFLLVAGSTTGDVRPVMDWRAAAAFGAGFAFVLGLLRRLRR